MTKTTKSKERPMAETKERRKPRTDAQIAWDNYEFAEAKRSRKAAQVARIEEQLTKAKAELSELSDQAEWWESNPAVKARLADQDSPQA